MRQRPWQALRSRIGGSRSKLRPGLTIVGYAASEKGVGEVVRSYARAATAASIPFSIDGIVDPRSSNVDPTVAGLPVGARHVGAAICVNADMLPAFIRARGTRYLRHHVAAGVWNWELERFPSQYARSAEGLCEIWVPSTFVQRSVAAMVSRPVRVIPYAVRPRPERVAGVDRATIGISDNAFLFLFAFDERSVAERKNPVGLIDAFRRAFPASRDVALVIKASRLSAETGRRLRSSGDPRIRIIDAVLSPDRMEQLYASADAYVSLHRSEGFGLTLAEAIEREIPTIATGYGGNVDFMEPDVSALVGYRLVELDRDHHVYPRGSVWAEPDLDEAAASMRSVVADHAAWRSRARLARQRLRERLDPTSIGEKLRDRLVELGAMSE